MGTVCLAAENISKSYHGVKVVDGVSFQVENGQVLGLIGTNGAGKSTTVSMLATLVKPDGGRILFHGEDTRKKRNYMRSKTGYVPQDIALYESLSGRDNLKFWGRASRIYGAQLLEKIEYVSEAAGLTSEMLKKKVQEYSGGMKRRLNIAAALLKEPELLILDEPTVGVDLQSRRMILDAIQKFADHGTAVVYVGHDMEEVQQLCNFVCVMHQGKVVLNKPLPKALKTDEGEISLKQLYEKILV